MVDPDQIAAIMDLPEEAEARTEDIASPEAVVHAVYASISGPAESVEQRDWDRLRSLFLPGARFVLARWKREDGRDEEELRKWDVEEFIRAAKGFYAESAFYERETGRRIDRFGNIAHVFSAYESRTEQNGEPVSRGINSVQLVRSRGRWWIAHLVWDIESESNPMPDPPVTP